MSAAPDTLSVDRGVMSAKLTRSSVRLERSSNIQIESTAEASGSRLGRIPKCPRKIIRGVRPPLNKHEKAKLKRLSRCFNGQFRSANQVVKAFLRALVTGDGALACLLLTPTEGERLGGVGCAQRIQAAAPGFAARNPFIEVASAQFGKQPQGEYVVRFDNPKDAVLLELGVVNNHWRISDTNNLFP